MFIIFLIVLILHTAMRLRAPLSLQIIIISNSLFSYWWIYSSSQVLKHFDIILAISSTDARRHQLCTHGRRRHLARQAGHRQAISFSRFFHVRIYHFDKEHWRAVTWSLYHAFVVTMSTAHFQALILTDDTYISFGIFLYTELLLLISHYYASLKLWQRRITLANDSTK
jgi:hypothetical protein